MTEKICACGCGRPIEPERLNKQQGKITKYRLECSPHHQAGRKELESKGWTKGYKMHWLAVTDYSAYIKKESPS